jgi:hypothetical protein
MAIPERQGGMTVTVIDERPAARAVHLRDGEMEQAIFRANRGELAKAKAILGYRSIQEMVVDLVERSVNDKLFRERRIRLQREALDLLDDIDLADLARITTHHP